MKGLFSNLCWTLKTEYQHIRYFPSAVRNGQATWANIFYISSGLRHWKANSMTAMTGRWDNDTSVKSKVERDRTVATKDGGCGRSPRWWNSNEAIMQCRLMCSLSQGIEDKLRQQDSVKIRTIQNDWFYPDSRRFLIFCCRGI